MIPQHRVLYDEEAIRTRIEELSSEIAVDLDGRKPVLLGLMMGSFMFLGDLARALSRRGVEPKVDLLSVSHYGMSAEPGAEVRIDRSTAMDLCGEAVLVVDDILDSGRSLTAVLEYLDGRPGWVRTCVLLDKPSRRKVPIEGDYVGFEVPNEWIIGYGLDLRQEGRGLPYIGAIAQSAIEAQRPTEEEKELA